MTAVDDDVMHDVVVDHHMPSTRMAVVVDDGVVGRAARHEERDGDGQESELANHDVFLPVMMSAVMASQAVCHAWSRAYEPTPTGAAFGSPSR